MTSLDKNEPLLNFCFLTASYYDFIINSGKIFKEIINKKENTTIPKNVHKELTMEKYEEESSIESNFQKANFDNYLDYIQNLSFLNINEKTTKKSKLELIKRILGDKYNGSDANENVLSKLCEKINATMLSDKFRLVKYLCEPTINFIFYLYDLFLKLLKNMEDEKNTKIKEIISKNLLEEESLKIANRKSIKEKEDLKNKINSLNQMIKKNKKNEEHLINEKKDLGNIILQLKTDMKDIQNQMKANNGKFIDEIKNLNSKVSLLTNTNIQLENSNNELRKCMQELENSNNELRKGMQELENSNNELRNNENENVKKLTNLNSQLKKELDVAKEDIKKITSSNNQLSKSVEECIRKEKIAEERYDYIKRLNKQILLELLCPDKENPETKNTNLEINGYIRLLNLFSCDNEVLETRLKEKEKELNALKNCKNDK